MLDCCPTSGPLFKKTNKNRKPNESVESCSFLQACAVSNAALMFEIVLQL